MTFVLPQVDIVSKGTKHGHHTIGNAVAAMDNKDDISEKVPLLTSSVLMKPCDSIGKMAVPNHGLEYAQHACLSLPCQEEI